MHVCYRDIHNLIQDAWFDGQGNWKLQTLTGGSPGNTSGQPAAGDPAIAVYNGQMHVCYRDTRKFVQDAW